VTPATKEEAFDAVVVGSGAGGGFAAMGLAEAGMRVLLLERGRGFEPSRDFPMNHPDWELRPRAFRDTEIPTGDASIVLEKGALLDQRYAHLRSSSPSGEVPKPRSHRAPFRYERVFGLGGTTLHYQGEAHRFPEHAFQPASLYGLGVDWPLRYADLAPHYERAEHVLGVAGDPANPFKAPRGPFPTRAHRLSYASQRIATGATKLGWTLLPNSLALPTSSVDGRRPCQRSGGCAQGCIFGAKSSVDLTAIRRAERTGRLQVQTESRVLALEMGHGGRVDGIVYRRAKSIYRARARVTVLAMGAVETPRLLLASRSADRPNGIANSSGLVGRFLLETLLAQVTVRFDERIDAYKGPPIDSRIWNFSRPRRDGSVRSGYVLGVSGTLGGFHGPMSHALLLPGFGRAHKDAMRSHFGTIVTLFGIAEQEPRAGNRVTLADTKDSDGVPLARVESAHSEADLLALDAMLERVKELASASGAAEMLRQATTYAVPAASHVGGTCRMGTDPGTSVVTAYGRSHDVPNLFIVDASVLPGQGAGDSPSLSIHALALRTAEHIVALARRREL
jgi:choline dehydrogenase-like flavoprotein